MLFESLLYNDNWIYNTSNSPQLLVVPNAEREGEWRDGAIEALQHIERWDRICLRELFKVMGYECANIGDYKGGTHRRNGRPGHHFYTSSSHLIFNRSKRWTHCTPRSHLDDGTMHKIFSCVISCLKRRLYGETWNPKWGCIPGTPGKRTDW